MHKLPQIATGLIIQYTGYHIIGKVKKTWFATEIPWKDPPKFPKNLNCDVSGFL